MCITSKIHHGEPNALVILSATEKKVDDYLNTKFLLLFSFISCKVTNSKQNKIIQ